MLCCECTLVQASLLNQLGYVGSLNFMRKKGRRQFSFHCLFKMKVGRKQEEEENVNSIYGNMQG